MTTLLVLLFFFYHVIHVIPQLALIFNTIFIIITLCISKIIVLNFNIKGNMLL